MKQWFLVLLSFILAGAFSSANAQQGTAAWSRRAGANLTDQANAVATDASGNVYVTGSFSGINANFGNGITHNSSGSEDIFLAKYSADGNTQWVRVAGASGTNADRGRSVAVDAAGNVYVAGYFEGTAIFPNTTLVSNGLRDGFIAKYDANGNFLWARRIGGVGRDEAYDVATDATGNVYVVGQFQNSINVGNTSLTSNGDFDFFVGRWDASGNPTWAISGGGATADLAAAVATDGNDVYVTGNFDGIASFEKDNPAFQRTSQGSFDVFLASYSAATGAANWVNIGGGSSADYGNDVIIERATGAIYTTGRFVGQGRFFGIQPNPELITSVNSSDDVFLTKYNRSGEILWARGAGSPNSDFGNALALDNAGSVYVAGQFQNTITFAPSFTATSRGNYDLFIARYNSNGNVDFAKGYGTTSLDVATGVSVFGDATYLAGYFNGSIQFDNNALLTSPGLSDIFVARLNFDVAPCNLTSATINAAAPANCAQQLTAVHSGSASSYNWYRNGLLITNVNTASISAAEAGSYAVEFLSGNCISPRSNAVDVNVANNLQVTASANPLSVNAGQSTILSVNVSGNTGATTITWRDDLGNVVGTGDNVNVTVNRTTSYTVQVTDNTSGCTRTGVVTVSVQQTGNCRTDADIVISISPGRDNVPSTPSIAEVCIGQGTGLQATAFIGNTNFTYNWVRIEGNNNVIIRQGSPVVESIDIPGFYRLQVSSPGCPVASSNIIELKKYPLPTSLTITSNQGNNACAQGSVILTATATGGTPYTQPGPEIDGGYKYRWSPANAVIGSNLTRTVTVDPSIATQFTCEVIDAIGCSFSNFTSVNPGIPTISVSPVGPITVCQGNNVALTAFINGTPTVNQVVRWYRNGVITGNTGVALTATSSGSYVAEIFDNVTRCFNRSNVVDVVIGFQAQANAGANRTICAGNSTQLGSGSVAGVTYNWSPADGLNNPNIANPIARPSFTTVYTLTVQSPNCPATSATVTVNVDAAASIVANGPTSFCEGGSVLLTVVNPTQGVNYTWRRNGFNVGGGTSFVASTPGTYTVMAGTCETNGIGVSIIDVQNVKVPKIRQFGSATLAICNNTAVPLFTDLMDGYSYQWWKDGQPIAGANSHEYSASEPGVYNVQVFVGAIDAACASKKSEGVFITRSNAAPARVWSEGDRTICAESNVCLKFHASTGHPNKNIKWEYMPATSVTEKVMTNNELELCVKPTITTTYTVMVMDDFGCTDVTTATVFINAIPAPQIGLNDICQRETASIPAPSGYTFWRLWTRTVNPNQVGVTDVNPAFTPIEASVNFQDEWVITPAANLGANLRQQYVLETSVEGCGMQYSNIATLNVRPNPTVTISGGNRTFCENNVQEVVLTANVSAGSYAGINGGTTSIVWNGSDIISQTGNTIRVRPATFGPGVYTYTAYVTNGQGCVAEASANITVIGRPDPFVFGGGVFCQGTSATITLTNPAEGYSIQWERSTTGTGNFSVVGGANTETLTTNQPGYYRARLSNTVCGNSFLSNVSDQVSFIPVPTVAADARRRAICWGEPIELFATTSIVPALPQGQSYTITWTDFNGNFITSNLGSRTVPNRLDLGTGSYPDSAANKTYNYTLTVTHPNGCSFSTIVPINLVKRGPVATATADKPVICEGAEVLITGVNTGQLSSEMDNTYMNLPASYRYVHYRWNGPATPTNPTGLLASGNLERNGVAEPGMVNNRTIAPLRVTPTTTTTYTLTLTSGLSECVATCEVTVKVGSRLVATVMNQTGNENLCSGPVVLEAICNTSDPGVQYQWYADINGQNMWVAIPGQTSNIYRPSTGGRYNVRVWLPGMEACYDYGDRWHTIYGVSGTVAQSNDLVTVLKDGDAVIQKEPAIVCAGQRVELTARYIFGAAYQWYSVTGPAGREQYTLIDGAVSRTYSTGTSGRYVVNVIAGCDECPDVCEIWSQVCPVVVLQELRPTVMHNGQIELCNGAHVELYTQGNESQYAYQWFLNGTTLAGETRSRIITRTDGRYTVEVRPRYTPVSGNYCRAMSENAVDVKPCSTGFCPKPISVRGVLNPDTPNSGQIRWDQPLNSSQYNLTGTYYVTLSRGNTVVFADRRVTNATFLNVTDLVPSTDYTVCVRTECTRPELRSEEQCGTFRTFSGSVIPDPDPVACPDLNQTNDIRVVGRTASTLDIEWDEVADIENNLFGYRVEVTTQDDQLVSTINIDRPANYPIDPIATATTVTGLSCNTVYIVYVRPRCANDVKERQTSNVAQTLDCGSGSVDGDFPISLYVTDLDEVSANIGWTPLAGADSYDIRWRVAGSGIDLGTANETNNSLVIENLNPDTNYEVSVRVNVNGTTTTFSQPIFFTTRARATCDRPRVSSVESTCLDGTHQFLINWLDPATEPGLGYQITWRRRGDNNSVRTDFIDPTSRSFVVSDMLTDNEVFDVDVVSICDDVTRDSVSVVIFTRNCNGGKLANNAANASVSYNIYPNPTNGAYNVSFNATEAQAVMFRMVDATGRIVYSQSVNVEVGENTIPVNANVSAGIYMLQIQNGSNMNTAKIVVE